MPAPDGFALAEDLKGTFLSYLTSALPIGNHHSQQQLAGEQAHNLPLPIGPPSPDRLGRSSGACLTSDADLLFDCFGNRAKMMIAPFEGGLCSRPSITPLTNMVRDSSDRAAGVPFSHAVTLTDVF